MRLIVNELPKEPKECMFSRYYGDDKHICSITGLLCKLIKSDKCNRLESLDEVKTNTIDILQNIDDGK